MTIIEKSNLITKILAKQKINKCAKYRPLRFLLIYTINSRKIIYNLLTREVIIPSEIESVFFEKDFVEFEEALSSLIENWFFVPVETDDNKLYFQISDFGKMFSSTDYISSFDILPTTDCNARCFYCYEKNICHINMTNKVATDVANYIIDKSKGNKVSIRWFGGEPLYNIEAIKQITSILNSSSIDFDSSIATNAYLFDSETILIAKNEWRLRSAQITLDGTEKVYNKRKNYIYNDVNPFKTVINNIEQLLKNNIKIVIRLNADSTNFDDLYCLVDFLLNKFCMNKYLKIYIQPILNFNNGTAFMHETGSFWQDFFNLEDYLYKKGVYPTKRINNKLKFNACMADSEKSILIMPDGTLGKCDNDVGLSDVGNIYNDILDQAKLKEYSTRKFFDECYSCELLPHCYFLKNCKMIFWNKCSKICKENIKRRLYRNLEYTISSMNIEENFKF